mmetsp:Transcript_27011/g.59048  ORF Transcript_27011/g.59048 Transcript_27011/m.59048 type:complete len:646 (+) Transcript_27011:226-2163(+)
MNTANKPTVTDLLNHTEELLGAATQTLDGVVDCLRRLGYSEEGDIIAPPKYAIECLSMAFETVSGVVEGALVGTSVDFDLQEDIEGLVRLCGIAVKTFSEMKPVAPGLAQLRTKVNPQIDAFRRAAMVCLLESSRLVEDSGGSPNAEQSHAGGGTIVQGSDQSPPFAAPDLAALAEDCAELHSPTHGEESFGRASHNERTTRTGSNAHLHRQSSDVNSSIPLLENLHLAGGGNAALETSTLRSQQATEQPEDEDDVFQNRKGQALPQQEDVNCLEVAEPYAFANITSRSGGTGTGTIQGHALGLIATAGVGDEDTRTSALSRVSPIPQLKASIDDDDTVDKPGHAHHLAVIMYLKSALDLAEPEGKLHELISSALEHHVSCYCEVIGSDSPHPNKTFVSDDDSGSEEQGGCPLFEGEDVENEAVGNEFALGNERSCGLAASAVGVWGEGGDGNVPITAGSTSRAGSESQTLEGTITRADVLIAPSDLVTVESALESRKESVSDMMQGVKFAVTHYDAMGSGEGGMDGSTRQYEALVSSGQLNGTVFMNEAGFIKTFEPGAKVPKRGLLIPGDAEEGVAQQAWVSQQVARKVHLDDITATKRRFPKHDTFKATADHIEWASADAKKEGSIRPWSRTSIIDDKKNLA